MRSGPDRLGIMHAVRPSVIQLTMPEYLTRRQLSWLKS